MKKLFIIPVVCLVFFACAEKAKEKESGTTRSGTEDTKKEESPKPAMSDSAMMKAWMDFATPGEMHKWLEKSNGTWTGTTISFSPGKPPDTSKATEVQSSMLGGLYVSTKFTTTMMGMPMEGMSMMGYDNSKKMFVSSWVDNMGSGIVQMSGNYDATSRTLHMKGKQSDPITGKDGNIRQEIIYSDDNNFVMKMYGDGPDGKEMKFMEGNFKKTK